MNKIQFLFECVCCGAGYEESEIKFDKFNEIVECKCGCKNFTVIRRHETNDSE